MKLTSNERIIKRW